MLIGQGVYDVIYAIKWPGHMSETQSKFRPGSDHNPIFGVAILR